MKWLASQRIHLLPLDRIDPDDTLYSLVPEWALSTRPRLSDIQREILVPLIGQTTDRGVRVVSGFRRLLSAREWQLPHLPVLLSDPKLPASELFKLPILENRSQRELTLLELSTIVGKLNAIWELSPERIIEEFFPLMGIPVERYQYKRLMRISRLSPPLKAGLDRLETEILLGMASWSESDQHFLLERLFRLKLGRNKQRQLWQLTSELRDLHDPGESSLDAIWRAARADVVEEKPDLSPADTFHQTLDRLRRLRYPHFTDLEDRKNRLIRALELPRPVQLIFPQFFEGSQIEFRFRAEGPAEVLELVQLLAECARSEEMGELFELL